MLIPRTGPTRGRPAAHGFTVFELMVVLGIIALFLVVILPSVGFVRENQVATSAYKISAHLRTMYERSINEGVPYRMTIDMDEKKVVIEKADNPPCGAGLTLNENANTRFKKLAQKEKEAKEKKVAEEGPEGGEVDYSKGTTVREFTLTKHVSIVKVVTQANPVPLESGTISVHAFPWGVVEKAIVVVGLEDKEDSELYIITQPYLGRARVRSDVDITKEMRL